MRKIYLYIVLAVLAGLGLYFLGAEIWQAIAGVLGLGVYGVIRENEQKIKEKKKEAEQKEQSYDDLKEANDNKISEAGDDIEEQEFDNHSDAADYIDDAIDDTSK